MLKMVRSRADGQAMVVAFTVAELLILSTMLGGLMRRRATLRLATSSPQS